VEYAVFSLESLFDDVGFMGMDGTGAQYFDIGE